MMQASGITQWQMPLAAPEIAVPLIAAETTIVPDQRLTRVMPRSWQFNPFAAKVDLKSIFGGAAIVLLMTSPICTLLDILDKQLLELG